MSETAARGSHRHPPVPLRAPDEVMRLARLGSFHQTRLSFMRVLLRRIAAERWSFSRPVFEIDECGVGHAVYALTRRDRTYSLVVFAHDLPAEQRSDRVIAEAWDATFALFDGVPTDADITHLRDNVPKQEAGRYRASALVLARANRSVRLFDSVVAALAEGRQPDQRDLEATGYLMRTTAVYGNGKFGIADRAVYDDREELAGPFQAEMLTVWLIRAFTIDIVEHLARVRDRDRATRLASHLRRGLGIGNATGLGMAPFLVRHPVLIHNWIAARETALQRVRALPDADAGAIGVFRRCLGLAVHQVAGWRTDDPVQAPRITRLVEDLAKLEAHTRDPDLWRRAQPWNALVTWGDTALTLEGQELLVSLVIEPHGAQVDSLAGGMVADEAAHFSIDGGQRVADVLADLDRRFGWAQRIAFDTPHETARFWYVSEEKLEPRLGERHTEPGAELEQPLAIARDVSALRATLIGAPHDQILADFLLRHPEHRHAVRRVQTAASHPYAEVRDNLIGADLRAIDLLRCKLSFFGCTRFDPRSDKWLRITLYQGAPYPDEIGTDGVDWEHWIWRAGCDPQ